MLRFEDCQTSNNVLKPLGVSWQIRDEAWNSVTRDGRGPTSTLIVFNSSDTHPYGFNHWFNCTF